MFYVVSKPIGISSNLVAKILKRVLKVSKIGFAWTLDPLATGLMIIGTDGSQRLFPLIENFTKTYQATIRLDGTTTSYDLEQSVEKIEVPEYIKKDTTKEYIESIIQKFFVGEIMQIPPIYSAVWIDGQRAYDLARKWQNFDIKAKKKMIDSFSIISYEWPTVIAKITVSHGTYIRTGWYLEKLERISIGNITLENISWKKHNDILYSVLSHEVLFPFIPILQLWVEEKRHLRLGSTPLFTKEKNGQYFVIYEDNSYGLLEAKEGLLFPTKNAV
jgi:tRNA pseudouridine55 synthase